MGTLKIICVVQKLVITLQPHIAQRSDKGLGREADIIESVYLTLFLDGLKSDSFLIYVKNAATVDALWICNTHHVDTCSRELLVPIVDFTYLREASECCSFNIDGQCQSLKPWDE